MTKKLKLSISTLGFLAGLGLGLWVLEPPAGPGPAGTTNAPVAPAVGPGGERGPPPAAEPPPPAWDPVLGAPPRFADVAEASGISFRHENGLTGKHKYLEIMGAGAGTFDADGDGDLDLYLVNGQKIEGPPSPEVTNVLYRNEGSWRFTDVTARAGVGDPSYGQGCCAGDCDADGDLDLYVSNFGPNVLYQNRGDGTFADATSAAGVGDPGWGQTCSFLDHDRDGWLDLYVQNYLTYSLAEDREAYVYVGREKVLDYPTPLSFRGSASVLFRNRRDGTFEDATRAAGLHRPDGKGMGVACLDLDDDGYADIFVANDTAENFLFRGRAGGTFVEVGLAAGVAYDGAGMPEASMGVDAGDYDRDGRLDLIVPCLKAQVHTLYRNRGDHFEDAASAAGLARATAHVTGFSASFFDYDSDGDLDLYFANGGVRRNEAAPPGASYAELYGMPDLLLANDGRGRFTDVSAHGGPWFRERRIGRGSVAADLDGDGDPDLVVSNLADRIALLRNDTSQGHWVTLELVAAGGRRNPFGASAWVEAGGSRQRSTIHGAVTYLSQGDPRLHFGLGAAAAIDRLEVLWPSGKRQVLTGLPADRVIEVREER